MSLSDAKPLDPPAVVRARMAHPGSHAARGWWPLLEELDARLSEIDSDYRLDQVKEKWGLLRVYLADESRRYETAPGLKALLAAFERRSSSVCQDCGALGQRQANGGRIFTLCDPCALVEGANSEGAAHVARLQRLGFGES